MVEIKRISEREVIKNLEPIWKDGKFLKKTEKIKGAISTKPDKLIDFYYLNYKGIDYFYSEDEDTIFTKVKNKPGPNFVKDLSKYNVEILQAYDNGYNLIVINSGQNQDCLVYNEEGKLIGHLYSYRREKNKLIGMKVIEDKVELYAESKSEIDKNHYYKLILKQKSNKCESYNLSGL
ncbi:MAG: hypothetical protein QXO12_01020 [Candidatus Pacearchaeota archaeon]